MLEKTPYSRAIAAFGGAPALADATGIRAKTIHSWGSPVELKGGGGRIPAKHQGAILKAARRLGLKLVAEDLIDMREPASVPEDVQ